MIRKKHDFFKPLVVILYLRYSDDLSNPRSIDQQRDTIRATYHRLGFPWVEIAEYVDVALGGRRLRSRPQFMKMMQDIRTRRIRPDAILVDMAERFARADQMTLLRRELYTKCGVLVLTSDSHFSDPTTISGQALATLETYRATSDAHVKGHNVRRGRLDAARQKHWPGGPIPFGYRLETIFKPGSHPVEVDYRIIVPETESASAVQRMYTLADERGWGAHRIVKHLNQDQHFVDQFGKISAAGVGHILSNPIYKGTYRYNHVSTDIVDDRRVCYRNDASEVNFVDDFCEAIVDIQLWERVNKRRRSRAEQIKATRTSRTEGTDKQIAALAPGITLKYPLVGLVRCPDCGASMHASKSGQTSYYYFSCPNNNEGRCSNDRHVRGDWLWEAFVVRLREWLFPLDGHEEAEIRVWAEPLYAEVRAEVVRLMEQDQGRRPLLERECRDLENKISGWRESLSDRTLSSQVRELIQHDLDAALTRKRLAESELDGLETMLERVDTVLNFKGVFDRLARLREVLDSGNATDLNVELALHVEHIHVYRDGRVVIRFNRLGVFEGAVELLAQPTSVGVDQPAPTAEGAVAAPRRRLLPRNTTTARDDGQSLLGSAARVVFDLADIPDRWIASVTLTTPGFYSWATQHAQAVHQLRESNPRQWTIAKLAAHFQKAPQTIRRALRIAVEARPASETTLPPAQSRPAKEAENNGPRPDAA